MDGVDGAVSSNPLKLTSHGILHVVSGSIKKLFSIDYANIYLFWIFFSIDFSIEFFSIEKCDQVYSNTRVSTQVNTSQHESTQVNTNQHESDTNQHESDTSQHKSIRVRHESTRINTSLKQV